MDFMSAKETAEKWNISQRRVALLCSENRIPGAIMVGSMWIIPTNAKKPKDARTTCFSQDSTLPVKPFIKWAGGKAQSLGKIRQGYPSGS